MKDEKTKCFVAVCILQFRQPERIINQNVICIFGKSSEFIPVKEK